METFCDNGQTDNVLLEWDHPHHMLWKKQYNSCPSVPVVSNLFNKPQAFVGREKVLSKISDQFANVSESAAFILYGGPGIGKTIVVSKYVSTLKYSQTTTYTHILLISFVSEHTFRTTISDSSETLKLPHNHDFDRLRDTLFLWFKNNQNYLVIFDNAHDTQLVKKCLETLNEINGHVLITTRSKNIDNGIRLGIELQRRIRIELKPWTESVTRQYINFRLDTPTSDADEEENLCKILRLVDGHPLVVEQMCSFMTTVCSCSFSAYYEKLVAKQQPIFDQIPAVGVSDYNQTLDATIKVTLDYLKQCGRKGSLVLQGAIGFVSNKCIPRTYLQHYLVGADIDADIDDCLSTLINISLATLEPGGKSVSVHIAIQGVIQRTLKSADLIKVDSNQLAISTMEKLLPKSNDGTFQQQIIPAGTALLPHIVELFATTNYPTSALASILFDAGYFALYTGSYGVAQNLFARSGNIYGRLDGSVYRQNVAAAMNYLGEIAKRQGKYEEAFKLYTKCLKVKVKIYGTQQHSSIAVTLHNLGDIANRQSKYTEAKRLYFESLEIDEKAFGTRECASVAATLNNLGDIAFTEGDFKEAGRLYHEGLAIKEKVFGTRDHTSVAITIHNVGDIAYSQGDFETSEKRYLESLEIKERRYGTRHHASVASTINNLGDVALIRGEYEKARKFYFESLQIKEKVYGTRQHANVATAIRNLGVVADRQAIFTTAYKTHQHFAVAFSINKLGDVTRKCGDYVAAEKQYNTALSTYQTVLNTRKHPFVATTINNLGIVARHRGDFGVALRLHLESIVIFENIYETRKHPDIAESLSSLGDTYDAMGDSEEANMSFAESHKIYVHFFGNSHPSSIEVLEKLKRK
ncbi:hypothetical protein HK098_007639 [Nowakowskiella sp. JEL0407]|nr:hypothetical protein HK098_007639 [Nowakowskiella sp. JEL0407]